MKKIFVSNVLINATREILKGFSDLKFICEYAAPEDKINANAMMELLTGVLERLKETHSEGDKIYNVLYFNFFTGKKITIQRLCEIVGDAVLGREITNSTLFRWKTKAIEIYAYVLWTNPGLSDVSLKIFSNSYLNDNYNEICMEHKKFING